MKKQIEEKTPKMKENEHAVQLAMLRYDGRVIEDYALGKSLNYEVVIRAGESLLITIPLLSKEEDRKKLLSKYFDLRQQCDERYVQMQETLQEVLV